MTTCWVDIETYSDVNLRAAGVYRYTESPFFEVLLASYSVDGKEVHDLVGEDEIRWELDELLLDPEVTVVAHNAGFERVCFSRLLGMPTGTYLDPARFRCTMARAAEAGRPQSLARLAVALGASPKDEAGTRLINLFCTPPRARPEDHPEKWAQFVAYCHQDVVTLIEVDRSLGDWVTESEHEVWVADQRINDAGMPVDLAMARAAVVAADENRMLGELEISALTGVRNPGSQPQLLGWLQRDGVELGDLRAESVADALETDVSPVARRVLEIRQELAGTATKKFQAALKSVSEDDRLRGGYRFFGAHTGRWTSGGVQLHNLPRESLETDAEVDAAIFDIKAGLGAEPSTLKALVRPMFVGPFTVVDYTAIEARVIAWLAGEHWALDAFRAGRDIYVETAQRMGGLSRRQGKIAVLALGFNGSIGSLRKMGAEGTDDELQEMVYAWRRSNPAIVRMWENMGEAFRLGGRAGRITVERTVDTRALRLPSGRPLMYHKCRWVTQEQPCPPGVNPKNWKGMFAREASFLDSKTGRRARTYGGRLCENVTQAVARDLLAEAMVRLLDRGYPVVGHTHDEVILDGEFDVDDIVKIMNEPPSWASGLPIDSAGFRAERYKK